MLSDIHSMILTGYEDYLHTFRQITALARPLFEQRDWQEVQHNARKRITLYKSKASTAVRNVKRTIRDQHRSQEVWIQLKHMYLQRISGRPDEELAKTFFNSICRKVYGGIGAREDIMFVTDITAKIPEIPDSRDNITFRIYRIDDYTLQDTIAHLLNDYQFQEAFENQERDVHWITARLEQFLDHFPADRIEMLPGAFYRNKAAYLVGRLCLKNQYQPFLIPLLNKDQGIFADTLILDQDITNIVFSFARSYFMVESEIPRQTIHFLQSIMPTKHTGDLYNAIGFNKHGKSVFYRDLLAHLKTSREQFIMAPGIPGLVMAVFTLPSYPVVFKLIKDKIDPPKKTSRGEVRSKYRLVKMIDRVGRLADTHEFEHLVFDRVHFSRDLREYLLEVAPSIVHVDDNYVIIDHAYTERKMIPLNLYLEQCSPEELEVVTIEYGEAIKQMAAANIFPGDMFLKNFGVTRLNRVIFYDYDEIGRLTDYEFREMPKARSTEELYAPDPWFAVGEKDVFPEEFKYFLVGKEAMREVFWREHSDLFTVKFWNNMQQHQMKDELVDVYPYERSMRFRDI